MLPEGRMEKGCHYKTYNKSIHLILIKRNSENQLFPTIPIQRSKSVSFTKCNATAQHNKNFRRNEFKHLFIIQVNENCTRI